MKFKDGVSLAGMWPQIGIAIAIADQVYSEYGKELVVTSVTDGEHKKGSLHPLGLACDLRTRYFTDDELAHIERDLRLRLTHEYDIVVESDHIHIEFDLKKYKE